MSERADLGDVFSSSTSTPVAGHSSERQSFT